ncbi:MAG: response regulator [Candidatus Dadabacteria bacterium]|nr:MAG: response regulator [Candidatus Dadabacteria bacterium]
MGSTKDDSSMPDLPLLGMSILIVNEDLGTREMMSRMIEELGAAVDKVDQAAEALEVLSHNSYDAVMLDETVACVNTHELAEVVKIRSKNANTSVIISGSIILDKEEALEAGADEYVEVPCHPSKLLESLIKSQVHH